MKRNFNAFTLAEVLITLGIIGVVAAMTMPTLINQTNGAQYKAAYKKALSAISQAVTLNVALEDISFADKGAETFLGNRMNVVKTLSDATGAYAINTDDVTVVAADNTTLFFNDGSVFSFPKGDKKCTKDNPNAQDGTACLGIIDVNGEKGPNKAVSCDGATWKTGAEGCKVTSPTDIYPVIYYDQTILPNTNAARSVLYGQ